MCHIATKKYFLLSNSVSLWQAGCIIHYFDSNFVTLSICFEVIILSNIRLENKVTSVILLYSFNYVFCYIILSYHKVYPNTPENFVITQLHGEVILWLE